MNIRDLPCNIEHVKEICSRYKRLVLTSSALILIWFISRDRWRGIREAYVHSHWVVAPKIQQLSGLDLSENHLYTDVLPLHGYHMPSGKGGCVWDVGANNGVYNSNSHYLIHEKKFKGFLYEPDAGNFVKLRELYRQDERTELFNFGLGASDEILRLRVFSSLGLENTVVSTKSGQFDDLTHQYSISVIDADILCKQLRAALEQGACDVKSTGSSQQTFTVLSVDIEGAGASVVLAAHRKCRDIGWDLLILETPPSESSMKKLGYKWMFKDHYNDVFRRARVGPAN